MRATVVSSPRLWSCVALLVCLHLVWAGIVRPLPRQGKTAITDSASAKSIPAASKPAEDDASSASATGTKITSPSPAMASPTASAMTAVISAAPFVRPNATVPSNSTLPGDLPLPPERTPGWFVAAIILMVTGLAYGLLAIRHPNIYCFFATGFSAAVGVTMIMLLLVSGKISVGLQAGFVVVVVVSGCILGGCAIFKPVAGKPIGCLLGGFCFGMWLLSLKPSALFGQESTKNAIFLSALSVLGATLYFPQFTRKYSMLASSAFTGATALVLGIDFVSNAGLKEYWVWIWNLNQDLFPPNSDKYPLKIGIKIEQGVTIVFFFAGMVVQWSKLEAVEKERARLELERSAGQMAVQREDEKARLEFERKIADERSEFEATLGGPRSKATYQGRGSRVDKFLMPFKNLVRRNRLTRDGDDSIYDDPAEESRKAEGSPREARQIAGHYPEDTGAHQTSTGGAAEADQTNQGQTSVRTRHDYCKTEKEVRGSEKSTVTTAPKEQDSGEDETKPAMAPKPTAAELVMGKDEEAGRVTVRVAVDEVELEAAARAARNPVPDVVPLPFKLPTAEDEEEKADVVDDDDDDDDSSLAVVPDAVYDNEVPEPRTNDNRRSSLAKRLSTSSTQLFRRLSGHSITKHFAKATVKDRHSTEDLVAPRHADRDSIAATCDDVSSVDDNDLPEAMNATGEPESNADIKAEPAEKSSDAKANKKVGASKTSGAARPMSIETVSTSILDVEKDGQAAPENITSIDAPESATQNDCTPSEGASTEDDLGSGPRMSQVFEAAGGPQTLHVAKLDAKVSQAVQTYRMVDWVKNQTKADEPELDNLDIPELCDPTPPRPVDVEDLMKTAEDGAPRIAKPRTASAINTKAHISSPKPRHGPRGYLSPHSSHLDDGRNSAISEQKRQADIQAAAAALAGRAGRAGRKSPSTPSEAPTLADSLRLRPPVPGIKPCNGPQSLVAQRETMLRIKEQVLRPYSGQPGGNKSVHDFGEGNRSVSALGLPSHSVPSSSPSSRRASGSSKSPIGFDDLDEDSITMRQRQALIRGHRTSTNSTPSSGSEGSSFQQPRTPGFPTSPGFFPTSPGFYPLSPGFSSLSPGLPPMGGGLASSPSTLSFSNPNPPHSQRGVSNASASPERASQLAGFRAAVQADLRAGTQALPVATAHHHHHQQQQQQPQQQQQQAGHGGYRAPGMMAAPLLQHGGGPLIHRVYNAIPGTSASHSLLPQQTHTWNAGVSRELAAHRQSMLVQRSAGAPRRDARRAERARQSQLRESNAVDGGRLERHSEMLWKLQQKANIQ